MRLPFGITDSDSCNFFPQPDSSGWQLLSRTSAAGAQRRGGGEPVIRPPSESSTALAVPEDSCSTALN